MNFSRGGKFGKTSMMEKWLKPERHSPQPEVLEQEAQNERRVLRIQEINKSSARIFLRHRILNGIRNKIIKEFVPETRNCRPKIRLPYRRSIIDGLYC